MKTRHESGMQVARVSILVNILLVALKGTIGYLSGSSALIADAAHSLGDVVSTIPVMVGFSISSRPPDSTHPYGHGRAEELTTAVLAGILLVTAALVARDGITHILGPGRGAPGIAAMGVAALSILVKEAMFRYAIAEGRRIGSDLLVADAWHHRSDALSSIAALVGIAGANAGIAFLDPLAAVAVAGMLFWTGASILRGSINALMDGRPPDYSSELTRVREMAGHIPGIVHVDDVRMRRYGGRIVMDVEISVDADVTVRDAHALAGELRGQLEGAHDHVWEVFVHVNPHLEHGSRS